MPNVYSFFQAVNPACIGMTEVQHYFMQIIGHNSINLQQQQQKVCFYVCEFIKVCKMKKIYILDASYRY